MSQQPVIVMSESRRLRRSSRARSLLALTCSSTDTAAERQTGRKAVTSNIIASKVRRRLQWRNQASA